MTGAVTTQMSMSGVLRGPLFNNDPWLLGCVGLLLGLGVVMVTSASMTIAERYHGAPLFFLWRQLVAASLGVGFGVWALLTPLYLLQRASALLLLLALMVLSLVLIPGIGREVNGSLRWVQVGSMSIQASEIAKPCLIIYLAAYLVRHGVQVREKFIGFIKPVGVFTVIAGLLLLEPDYGAAGVLFVTCLGMLFLAGVSLPRFLSWGLVAMCALAELAMLAPYRLKRLMTFVDPWADPYDSGFQLTQALIAFGRGEWFGVGLGSSIQKMFYLPEVHTDFVFAVIAEELGLAGTVSVILAFTFLIWRALHIGGEALKSGRPFHAYLANGIGLLIGLQAFINMGVNMGVLPTKGLTLPLISYGSNSLVVTCFLLGVLLRVAYECKQPLRVRLNPEAWLMRKPIVIMAGGTGGHVYPALAVAGWLRHRHVPLLWLGSRHGLETRVVPQAGLTLLTLPVSGLRGKRPITLLLAPLRLLVALWQSLRLLMQARPAAVLGMGGFASGPGGMAAWLLRIPLLVHEQNAIAGLTNRVLAPLAARCLEAFPGTFRRGLRSLHTGNPVREEIIKLPEPQQRHLGEPVESLRLLVLGGSQGAKRINEIVPAALAQLGNKNIEVWHQTGTAHLETTRAHYAKAGITARSVAYIDDMAAAYGWADLVIGRAGAMTVAELAAAGIGSILVPFPHAVDDHQSANARWMVKGGGTILLPEPEFAPGRLAALLEDLMRQRQQLLVMAQAARRMAMPDATERVGRACLEVAYA